jgi:hypothetical protein
LTLPLLPLLLLLLYIHIHTILDLMLALNLDLHWTLTLTLTLALVAAPRWGIDFGRCLACRLVEDGILVAVETRYFAHITCPFGNLSILHRINRFIMEG